MAHEGGKDVSPMRQPPLPPVNIPGTHFCLRLSQPQGHSVALRIMSMKNSSDTIRNRTHDLPACSAVPQPTVPPRAPHIKGYYLAGCTTFLHLPAPISQLYYILPPVVSVIPVFFH